MDILYLLIPLSLVLVFLIAIVFWWSLRSGQYDDLEGPGFQILMDDDGSASGLTGQHSDVGARKLQGQTGSGSENRSAT